MSITSFLFYLAIKIMIRIGSLATVKANRANAGPYAMKAQPKNSKSAIF